MPQDVIIAPYVQRQRGKMIAATTLGQGVQQGLFMLAQGIDEYRKMKEQENDQKLKIMTALGTKYGFNKMGPDFMHSWEKLSGVQLPRNAKGEPELPQTAEEQIQAIALPKALEEMNSPQGKEIALGVLDMAQKPRAEGDRQIELYKMEVQDRHNRAMEGIEALGKKYAYLAAMAKANRPGGSTNAQIWLSGSGYMNDPDNPDGPPVAYVPGKGTELNNKQLKNKVDVGGLAKGYMNTDISRIRALLAVKSQNSKSAGIILKLAENKSGEYPADAVAKAQAAIDPMIRSLGVDPGRYKKPDGSYMPEFLKGLFGIQQDIDTVDPQAATLDNSLEKYLQGINIPYKSGTAPAGASTPTTTPNAQTGTTTTVDPTASWDDEQLSNRVSEAISKGYTVPEILEMSGNSPRVQKLLNPMRPK